MEFFKHFSNFNSILLSFCMFLFWLALHNLTCWHENISQYKHSFDSNRHNENKWAVAAPTTVCAIITRTSFCYCFSTLWIPIKQIHISFKFFTYCKFTFFHTKGEQNYANPELKIIHFSMNNLNAIRGEWSLDVCLCCAVCCVYFELIYLMTLMTESTSLYFPAHTMYGGEVSQSLKKQSLRSSSFMCWVERKRNKHLWKSSFTKWLKIG